LLVLGCARGTAGEVEEGKDPATDPGPGSYPREGSSGQDDAERAEDDEGRDAGADFSDPSPHGDGAQAVEPDAGSQLSGSHCAQPLSCQAAEAAGIRKIGSIAWSSEDLVATLVEAGSRFYLVGVTGDAASEVVRGGIRVRLSAAQAANYDVFLYGGAEGYDRGLGTCEGPSGSSQNPAGAVDEASHAWAAGAFGALTDRTVTIEVRHVAGPCEPFTLEVYGAKE
jgi:hypothetical protein